MARRRRFNQPHTVGFYCNANADLKAHRNTGETHSFITVELSRQYVETQVHSMEDDLHPALRRWLINKGGSAAAVGAMSPRAGNHLSGAAPAARAGRRAEALVPGENARASFPGSLSTDAAGGIFLPAPEAGRPRTGGTLDRDPAQPSVRSARHRGARRAGWLQFVLPQPPLFEGNGHDHFRSISGKSGWNARPNCFSADAIT